MKEKRVTYKLSKVAEPSFLKDAPATETGRAVSVRDAKAHLSALLDWVALGNEVTITSDGAPKAKLVRAEAAKPRKVFQGLDDYLMSQPIHSVLTADEAINEDRDSRGW
jgi:prevent-host-death family protein